MKTAAKRIVQSVFLVLVFPAALLSGFGSLFGVYLTFAHVFALVPGPVGDLCRTAYYRLTLRECSADTVISFGTFFSRTDVRLAPHVSIGAYCVIGSVRIGEWTQISSHVEIPGGRHQHARDAEGRLGGTAAGHVEIGAHCWIGASAIVMASVGAGTTVGAGAVVVKDLPEKAVAVGNPARVIRQDGVPV